MKNDQLIREINHNMAIVLPEEISLDELKIQLGGYVNQLIQNDFQKLITILYRIDVSELKLKKLLKQNPDEEAGIIIATLIIERQLEKIKTRQRFDDRQQEGFTGDEKW